MELQRKVTKRFEYDKNGTKLEFGLTLGTREVRDFLSCLKQAVIDIEKEMEVQKGTETEIK